MTNTARGTGPGRGRLGLMQARPVLFGAFAFAVMADPVSSVAYAIEACLTALTAVMGRTGPTTNHRFASGAGATLDA